MWGSLVAQHWVLNVHKFALRAETPPTGSANQPMKSDRRRDFEKEKSSAKIVEKIKGTRKNAPKFTGKLQVT